MTTKVLTNKKDAIEYVNKLTHSDLDLELSSRGLSPRGNAKKRKGRLLTSILLEIEERNEEQGGKKSEFHSEYDSDNDSKDENPVNSSSYGIDESRFETLEKNVSKMNEEFQKQCEFQKQILSMLSNISGQKGQNIGNDEDEDSCKKKNVLPDEHRQGGASSLKTDQDMFGASFISKKELKRFDSDSSLTNKEFKDIKRKFEHRVEALCDELNDIREAVTEDENDGLVKVGLRRLQKEAEKCEVIIDKLIDMLDDYPEDVDELLRQWREIRSENKKAENDAEDYLKKCRFKEKENERRKDNVKLPDYKVPEFYGNILQWPSWIQSFTRVIHSNKDLDKSAKYEYLMSRLKGEARHAVRGFGGDEKNYDKVMDALKTRYGDERLITKRYLEYVLSTKELDKRNVNSLRALYNRLTNAYGTLESYNINKEAFYLAMFEKPLPPQLKQEWEKHYSQIRRESGGSQQVTVKDFFDFLLDEVQSLEATERTDFDTREYERKEEQRKNDKPRTWNGMKDNKPRYSSAQALTTKGEPGNCIFCDKSGHDSMNCHEAMSKAVDERWKIVKAARCCFNCLRPMGRDHNSNTCKGQPCGLGGCEAKHAQILHKGPRQKTEELSEKTMTGLTTQATDKTTGKQKLCPVTMGALIYQDKEVPVRVFLDSGSKDSYVRENIAESLGMERIHPATLLKTTGFAGVVTPQKTKRVKFSLSKRNYSDDDEAIEIEAWTTKRICEPIEPISVDFKEYAKAKDLDLADEYPRGSKTVDVLIGIDYYDCFIKSNKVKLDDKLYAQDSTFGWIIRGIVPKTDTKIDGSNNQVSTQNMLTNTSCEQLNDRLKAFWELETLGITEKRCLIPDDQEAVRQFDETLKFDEREGRYTVGLLWRKDHPKLKDNYEQALKRLKSVERMLQRNIERREMYVAAMNKYINEGHAREVREDETVEEIRYLPHHPVFRHDKTTTKCRIVFDASAKIGDEVSLNDCLLEGPNILPDMVQVLMRFRSRTIGLVSDIQSMFLQVLLREQDQQVHRFLWRGMNTDIEPKIYCKTRMTFGVKSSPYECEATIHELAKRCEKDFPKAAEEVKENMYMDDYVGGEATPQEAIRLQRDMTEMMKRGGFKLTKWASNSEEVMRQIPEEERDPRLIVELDDSEDEAFRADATLKTLGVVWDTSDDCLIFKHSPKVTNESEMETKRTMLSKIAGTFDPLGMYTPFTVRAKKLVQDAWIKGIQWDEPLPVDIAKQFEKWKGELKNLDQIRIQRCFVGGLDTVVDAPPHGFCDSSERCYGGAIYLRLRDDKDKVKTHLVMSKNRLAPTKKVTLPRLELCGALIMTRLLLYVKEALNKLNISRTVCWTDSMIVLNWLRKPAGVWKNFIANRVQEIQDKLDPSMWKHVTGEENPSDLLTRGISLEDLKTSQLWWKGPHWLSLPENQWPSQPVTETKESLTELKKSSQSESMTTKSKAENAHEPSKDVRSNEKQSDKLYPYFSKRIEKWTKLLRVTARILSWRKPSVKRQEIRELTVENLREAEKKWLKLVQLQHFADEYEALLKGNPVSTKSRILHLDPVLKDGLIRVGGRLQQAQIPEDAKHQVILPHMDDVVEKLILDAHVRNAHAGPETTLSILRERYWITKGRREVKRVLRKFCLLCRLQATVPQGQKMANLPVERLRTWTHAGFVDVGVDFTGPVYVKDGKQTKKTWICLFVCGNTRAVHFELTLDMTTETFLDAYRRMINRRGISETIHSDNQTSFHKANRVLSAAYSDAQKVWKKIDHKEVQRRFATMGIKWKFITERASHQGGWWERYCRMLKRPLKAVLGKALLTYQELETVLTDIEAQVNSRPITYIGDDVRDGMHLTPAHLLIGRPLGQLPRISNQRESNLSLQKRFLYRQRVADHFWQRWMKEYLPNLNVRKKWLSEKKPLHVGDVVLVAEDKTPRGKWILAKVVELYTGRDGLIRNAKLKTAKGHLNRSVHKLHLLESAEAYDLPHEEAPVELGPETVDEQEQPKAKPELDESINKERIDTYVPMGPRMLRPRNRRINYRC